MSEATHLDQCDLDALRDAFDAMREPQAAMAAIRQLISRRYQLGPMDALDLATGAITRIKPDPQGESGS